jgi:hypothetical protein
MQLLGRRRLNELTNAGYNVKLSAPLDNIPFSKHTERERIEQAVCILVIPFLSFFRKKKNLFSLFIFHLMHTTLFAVFARAALHF